MELGGRYAEMLSPSPKGNTDMNCRVEPAVVARESERGCKETWSIGMTQKLNDHI